LGAVKAIATHLTNIGVIFYKQRQFDEAVERFTESRDLHARLGKKNEVMKSQAWIDKVGKAKDQQKIDAKKKSYF